MNVSAGAFPSGSAAVSVAGMWSFHSVAQEDPFHIIHLCQLLLQHQ